MPAVFLSAFQARTDLAKYGANALLLFALELKYQLPDIDSVAINALTDGPDDKKCDLIYVDRERGLAIVAQGYMASDATKAEAKANKATDLNGAASWLLTTAMDELPPGLQSAAGELRAALENKEIDSLQFWYVHNLPESSNVRNELKVVANTVRAACETYYPMAGVTEITAVEVGTNTLDEWYRSLTIPILVTDDFAVTIEGGFEIAEADWQAFVTAVPAAWLYEVFEKYGSQLFSANVRGYLGSRKAVANINNGIKDTASDNPAHFWVYNNGITALVHAFQADIPGKQLKLAGLSIVNGAQTTGALGSLKYKPDSTAKVQARFVVCKARDTVMNIIKYNNSQNRIEAPDFRSNDVVQKRLVAEFQALPETLYLGGRRGGDEDAIKRPANLLPSDTVAQALTAFHREPIVAYHEKSRIWISDSLYSQVFNERTTAQHIVLAYTLLRALEEQKRVLQAKEAQGSLTEDEGTQLEFFRHRGSTILATSAVAACVETFADRAIPDAFQVSFKDKVPPRIAQQWWAKVIETTLPFMSYLTPAVQRGLQNSDTVKQVIDQFRSFIAATKRGNKGVYDDFTAHLHFD